MQQLVKSVTSTSLAIWKIIFIYAYLLAMKAACLEGMLSQDSINVIIHCQAKFLGV